MIEPIKIVPCLIYSHGEFVKSKDAAHHFQQFKRVFKSGTPGEPNILYAINLIDVEEFSHERVYGYKLDVG